MRKLLSVCLVFLVLLGSSVAMAQNAKVTYLVYSYAGDKKIGFIEEKAAEFMQLNPDVSVEVIVGNQDKFQTMLAGGVEPDILDLPDFAHLGPIGMFVDMKPLLQKDGLMKEFNPAIINWMTSSTGELWKFPEQVASTPIFFNRTLFDETGLTTPDQLGEAWNWDAVMTSGKKLTYDKDGDGTPEAFGVDRGYAFWQRAVAAAGGELYEFDADLNPIRSTWNSPEVLQGVEFVVQMFREGIIPWGRVPKHDDYFFWRGKTALDLVDAIAISGTYLSDVSFEWDLALQPKGPAGFVAAGAGGVGPHIMASTKNLDATWNFMKFLYANIDNAGAYAKAVGVIPALTRAQPMYAQVAGLTEKNAHIVFEQLNYLRPSTGGALPPELSARKVDMWPLWRLDVSPREHLLRIHEEKSAFIADMQSK